MDDLFSTPSPEARIHELRAELQRHNRLYYTDAAPEISDADYDALKRRAPRARPLNEPVV